MKIYMLESADWENCSIKKETIQKWVEADALECSKILGEVSPNLNIIVKPNLPHTSLPKGVGGSTYDHELLDITFDTTIPAGEKEFRRYLKETAFHEMNHAMHMFFHPREARQLYWTVLEGLGTVFDRDYAKGEHFTSGDASTEEKIKWINQNLASSTRSPNAPEDWGGMMYQAGTMIVDKAIKESGKNVIELTKLSCDQIVKLSKLEIS
jgi:hypothetical protein